MPDKQIFYDPERKRWKRLRRVLDAIALVSTLVVAGFIFNTLHGQRLHEMLLPVPRHNYRALRDRTPLLKHAPATAPRRKSNRRPSDITLNTGEGLRAAFYVSYDPTSYSSFKEHVHQIDMLFPDWLHVNADKPALMAMSSINTLREYQVIENGVVHDPDDLNKVKHVIQDSREDTEDLIRTSTISIRIRRPGIRPSAKCWPTRSNGRRWKTQIVQFFTALPFYRGLSLDFESLNDASMPDYMTFVKELYGQLHARNLKLWVNAGVGLQDKYMKTLAANSDGIILMNYDQHEVESNPGPDRGAKLVCGQSAARAQSWFPSRRSSARMGNYGYDWTMSIPGKPKRGHKPAKPQVVDTEDLSVPAVWERASDADADLNLDYDTLNPHFEYIDEDNNQRHVVWFLDAVTVLNEMRAARELGLQTFALWRLGYEDSSLWNIWDKPSVPAALRGAGVRCSQGTMWTPRATATLSA